jgi:hypothetical protein
MTHEAYTTECRLINGHPLKPTKAMEQDRLGNWVEKKDKKTGLSYDVYKSDWAFYKVVPPELANRLDADGKPDPVLAFDKDTAWAAMVAIASGGTGQLPAKFSYKFYDGDVQNVKINPSTGKPNPKEERAGCIVLTIESRVEAGTPHAWYWGGHGWMQMGADQLKTGDYCQLSLSLKHNGEIQQPGCYVNLTGVNFVRGGVAIANAAIKQVDPNAVFGMRAPTGFVAPSAAPVVAPQAAMPPQQQYATQAAMPPQQQYATQAAMPPQQQYATQAAMPPQQQYATQAAMPPQQQVQPAYDVVQNAGYTGPMPGQFPAMPQ